MTLDEAMLRCDYDPDLVLDLDRALDELEAKDPRQARLVMLRVFSGMSNTEAAEALGVSERTVKRDWAFARAWLYGQIAGAET